MTECYEMHQPDKKKIEELKNISLGIDALPTQTTMKSFSQAQSFFKGMVRFEKTKQKTNPAGKTNSIQILENNYHSRNSLYIKSCNFKLLNNIRITFYRFDFFLSYKQLFF